MIAELDRVEPGIEDLEENEIRPCVEHLELRDGHEPFGQRLGFLDALYAGLLVINLVLEAKPEKFLGQRIDVPNREEATDFAEHWLVGRGHQAEAKTAHAEILTEAAHDDQVREL